MDSPKLHFIAAESIQHQLWSPVAEEANLRGFHVTVSDNSAVKADIGFYCDDASIPGPQTLTVIAPNGIDQRHDTWANPQIFFSRERWGLFDLGLLPGPTWALDYIRAAHHPDCAPAMGSVVAGWPKSDYLFPDHLKPNTRISGHHERRILYAPNIECDGKQDALIEQLSDANVRLLIKHWESRDEMEKYPGLLTESYLENLNSSNERAASQSWIEILSPLSNFIDALDECDILISDQSSVLAEALLCGVPTIAVSDWRHNCGLGCVPDRREVCVTSSQADLRSNIETIFSDYALYVQRALALRGETFANLGHARTIVLDTAIGAWNLKKHLANADPKGSTNPKLEQQHQQALRLLSQLTSENRKLQFRNQVLRQVGELDQSALFGFLRRIRRASLRYR